MNTKLVKLFSALTFALVLASCGKTTNTGSTSSGTDTQGTDTNVDRTPYTVAVFNPDGTRYSKDDISVQWCTLKNCLMPVQVDPATGIATGNFKDNEYYIHLLSCPEGLTYDPNAYFVTPTQKHCDLQLLTRLNARLEDEGTNSKSNCYMIEADSYYKVNTSSNTDEVFFGFRPTETGVYKIESYEQVLLNSEDENPSINYYGLDRDMVPETPLKSDDNSKDGVNFSMEINVPDAESSFLTFGVSSTSMFGESEFDIRITRIGDARE